MVPGWVLNRSDSWVKVPGILQKLEFFIAEKIIVDAEDDHEDE